MQELGIAKVDGVLLDLGISSPQIDEGARGFSFRFDGPLDMRMDTSKGQTAAEWLAQVSEDELREVIKSYGEERFAKQIARAIVAARAGEPVVTTRQLAEIVAKAVPRREPGQDPATRTFQAIRIFLNQELEELSLVLPQCVDLLAPGGRLVVISFHSLEDRIVKRFMQGEANRDTLPSRLPMRAERTAAAAHAPDRQGARPSAAEVAANPRCRSAVMRVAERTGGRLMVKLNLLLMVIAVICAMGVVTSQHKARKMFVDLQQEEYLAKQMEVEWGQLQLEQSTWAMHARIEKIASSYLQMKVPDPTKTQIVPLASPAPWSQCHEPRHHARCVSGCRCGAPGWWSPCCCCGSSPCWCARLYLQVLNNDFLRQKGDARYSRVIELSAHRGMITDRQGEPLAISTPVESVWASPQDIELTAGEKAASGETAGHEQSRNRQAPCRHQQGICLSQARHCRRNRPPRSWSSAFRACSCSAAIAAITRLAM